MTRDARRAGFVRHLDQLGRLVLPMEWRKVWGIGSGAQIEIIPGEDGMLILQRYVPRGTCTFCSDGSDLEHFAGHPICRQCALQIGTLGHGQPVSNHVSGSKGLALGLGRRPEG